MLVVEHTLGQQASVLSSISCCRVACLRFTLEHLSGAVVGSVVPAPLVKCSEALCPSRRGRSCRAPLQRRELLSDSAGHAVHVVDLLDVEHQCVRKWLSGRDTHRLQERPRSRAIGRQAISLANWR